MCSSDLEFVEEFIDYLDYFIEKYPDCSFKVITPITKCLINKKYYTYFSYGCHIFSGSGLVINTNNEITPCTHWIDYPIAKINSNISFEEFTELWSKLEKYRLQISKMPLSECSICSKKDSCHGGCPIFWRVYNPKNQLNPIKKKIKRNNFKTISSQIYQ